MGELVVLTREGCAEEPLLRERLEEALKSMEWPAKYRVVDLATLPRTDGRRGYPDPNRVVRWARSLWDGRTSAAVSKTHVTPYQGGVPSSADIRARLISRER